MLLSSFSRYTLSVLVQNHVVGGVVVVVFVRLFALRSYSGVMICTDTRRHGRVIVNVIRVRLQSADDRQTTLGKQQGSVVGRSMRRTRLDFCDCEGCFERNILGRIRSFGWFGPARICVIVLKQSAISRKGLNVSVDRDFLSLRIA